MIQTAVNKWTEQLEEQVNLINDKVEEKVDLKEFEKVQGTCILFFNYQ